MVYPKPLETRSVLLVEDDPLLRKMCREFLEELGFQVHEAESGEDALILLHSQRVFNLLLIDINLGNGINGMELMESVKRNSDSHIIIMSGTTNDDNQANYLEKPFSMKKLGDAIESLFSPR